MNKLAGLNIPKSATGASIESRIDAYSRRDILSAIANLGVDSVATAGFTKDALNDDTVPGLVFKADSNGRYGLLNIDPTQIGVIRNTAKVIGGSIPELNSPDVGKMARNKLIANSILGHTGYEKVYVEVNAGNYIDVLSSLSGTLVLKPVSGGKSEGVTIGTAQQILELMSADSFAWETSWMIEEHISLGNLPVEGLGDSDKAKLQLANDMRVPSELRVYTFGSDYNATLGVVRVAKTGEKLLGNDSRVFVDQDSIPDQVLGGSLKIGTEIMRRAGVKEAHLAVDWVVDSSGAWIPMEVNGSEPELVDAKVNQAISGQLVTSLAKQIIRTMHEGE